MILPKGQWVTPEAAVYKMVVRSWGRHGQMLPLLAEEDAAFAIWFLSYRLKVMEVKEFLYELMPIATNFTSAPVQGLYVWLYGSAMNRTKPFGAACAESVCVHMEQPWAQVELQKHAVLVGSDWCPSQAGGGLAQLCAAVNAAYQQFGEVTVPVWAHCDPGGTMSSI